MNGTDLSSKPPLTQGPLRLPEPHLKEIENLPEGLYPKSPEITGPCGIATLLHRIGGPQLLERLLDVEGTKEFDLRVHTGEEYLLDVYVRRRGNNVEIGFISYGEWAQHGVRYLILPARSPYRIGAWSPLSTSDQGSPWGGSNIWVRGQGAFVAKAIWFHEHFNNPIEVSWSGMSDSEKEDLAAWLEERAELRQKEKILQKKEYEELKALHGDELHEVQAKMAMDRYYESQLACRAECGEENPKFTCSKCRIVRYCSAACQTEDWKYHKTFCGKT